VDIIGSGGIPALVSLLDEGVPEAQAHAAEVLVTLSAVDDHRKRLITRCVWGDGAGRQACARAPRPGVTDCEGAGLRVCCMMPTLVCLLNLALLGGVLLAEHHTVWVQFPTGCT